MFGMTLKPFWKAVRAIIRTLERHRSMGIAAEMSFWLFCSLIPLAVTAVVILAQLPATGTTLIEAIFAGAPDATRALVAQEVAGLAHNRVRPSLLNIVVFVWLASSGLHAVYDGFEAQLGVETAWWRKRLRALLGCAVLSFGIALLALLGAGFTLLSDFAPVLAAPRLGLVLRSASALLVLWGLVAGLYRLGIPRSARHHVVLVPGTLAVVFLIGTVGFGYQTFLATVGDGSAYQAGLSVVVITLTALFLFSLAMLLGLAINQEIARRMTPGTWPGRSGTNVPPLSGTSQSIGEVQCREKLRCEGHM